jgi:hypothetical protein
MKNSTISLTAFFAAFLLLVGAQGCYTQVGSTRDEVYNDDNNGQVAQDNSGGESAEGVYADSGAMNQPPGDAGHDWTCQVHMGFDGYYPSAYWPSVGFSLAYNDPWYGWYDPWYSYGYGYGGGYGYGYGYGYPYYPYYDPWYGYPAYGYPVEPVPWQNREFGSTRKSGNSRGAQGVNASRGAQGVDASRGAQGVDASNGMRGGINDQPLMDLPTASGRLVTGGTSGGTNAGTRASSATKARPGLRASP